MQKPFKDFQITINGSTLNNHSHLDYGKEVSLFDVRSMFLAVTEMVSAIIADESQQLFPGNPDAEKLLENYNLNRDFN